METLIVVFVSILLIGVVIVGIISLTGPEQGRKRSDQGSDAGSPMIFFNGGGDASGGDCGSGDGGGCGDD